jgi:hypothetical protein
MHVQCIFEISMRYAIHLIVISDNLFLLVTRSLFSICLEERKVVIYLLSLVKLIILDCLCTVFNFLYLKV